jgi:hypothetical protein
MSDSFRVIPEWCPVCPGTVSDMTGMVSGMTGTG